VLRGGSGSAPVIVDIYDKYSLFMSQLAKRRAFYKKIGFAIQGDHIQEKKEDPEEIMFIDD
jgi:hypothetical protein